MIHEARYSLPIGGRKFFIQKVFQTGLAILIILGKFPPDGTSVTRGEKIGYLHMLTRTYIFYLKNKKKL